MMELLARKLAVAALIGSLILPSAGVIAADNNGNSAVSVTADKLEYNGKTQVATATGNVVIVRDQATMTGNKGVYNLKTSEADMEATLPSSSRICSSIRIKCIRRTAIIS